jgi:uncharacterized protein YpmS
MKKDSVKTKKTKIKIFLLFAIPLVVLVFTFFLLMHKPADYAPLRITDQNQISLYLTHNILPAIYNNSQLDNPFEIVITEEGLNDIIARWPQSLNYDNITISNPQVILTQNQVILMATAQTEFASPVLTIRISPAINSVGQLNIHIDEISLGAAGITALAKSLGNKALADWLIFTGTEPNDIAILTCRSLLYDEPFEPVFKIGEKSIRLCKIKLEKKKITALLQPLPDTSRSHSKKKNG